jgi:hypothetical protein
MDISKLPRLSETGKHAPAPSPAPDSEPQIPMAAPVKPEPRSIGADVWFSIAIGALILLMYPRFLQWVSSRVFGTHFNEFMLVGKVVPYPQVPEFWSDLGTTSFGLMLIIEGVALALLRRRGVLIAAFGLTVVVTAYNLIYLVASFSKYGLALVSALAVIFGVYIAMYQWRMLQASKVESRA